jgi:tetratricopeptide (TPR) repeat protein
MEDDMENITLFLSYSWAQKHLANEIESAFKISNIKIKRDIKDVPFNTSISSFMKEIRSTDFVLFIISHEFLTSHNCMFEATESMKDLDHSYKSIFIIEDNANIHNPEYRINIVKFWKNETQQLKDKLSNIAPEYAIDEYKNLKKHITITNNINEFLAHCNDKHSKKYSELRKYFFIDLFIFMMPSLIKFEDDVLKILNNSDQTAIFKSTEELYEKKLPKFYAFGLCANIKGTIEKKIEYCSLTLKHYPNESMFYVIRGNLKSELADFNGALNDYNKAVLLDQNNIYAYNARGVLKGMELSLYEEAFRDFKIVLSLDDMFAQAYMNLGHLKYKLLNYQSAIKDYEKAIELDPSQAICYYHLACAINDYSGDYDKAIKILDKAIEIDFLNAILFYQRGMSKAIIGDNLEALRDFDTAIELDPSHANAFHQRGICKNLSADYRGALEDLDIAIELNPANGASYYFRGNAKSKLGDKSGAVRDFEIALELDSSDFREYIHFGLAMLANSLKDYKKAIKNFNKTIEFAPNDKENYFQRGMCYYMQSKYKKAIYDLDKTIELDPENEDAYSFGGLARHHSKKYDEAIRYFDKAIELNHDDPYTYLNRCYSKLQTKDYYGAKNDYLKAVELDPMTKSSDMDDLITELP